MITMQLTPQDIADAKKVIDAQALNLTSEQICALYNCVFRAQAKVGTTYEMVPAQQRRGRRPLWGLRAARKQLGSGPT